MNCPYTYGVFQPFGALWCTCRGTNTEQPTVDGALNNRRRTYHGRGNSRITPCTYGATSTIWCNSNAIAPHNRLVRYGAPAGEQIRNNQQGMTHNTTADATNHRRGNSRITPPCTYGAISTVQTLHNHACSAMP